MVTSAIEVYQQVPQVTNDSGHVGLRRFSVESLEHSHKPFLNIIKLEMSALLRVNAQANILAKLNMNADSKIELETTSFDRKMKTRQRTTKQLDISRIRNIQSKHPGGVWQKMTILTYKYTRIIILLQVWMWYTGAATYNNKYSIFLFSIHSNTNRTTM